MREDKKNDYVVLNKCNAIKTVKPKEIQPMIHHQRGWNEYSLAFHNTSFWLLPVSVLHDKQCIVQLESTSIRRILWGILRFFHYVKEYIYVHICFPSLFNHTLFWKVETCHGVWLIIKYSRFSLPEDGGQSLKWHLHSLWVLWYNILYPSFKYRNFALKNKQTNKQLVFCKWKSESGEFTGALQRQKGLLPLWIIQSLETFCY